MVFLAAWLVLLLLLMVTTTKVRGQAKERCELNCGEVSINYPFGMGPECYLDEAFKVDCSANGSATLAKADLKSTFVISEIRIHAHQVILNSSKTISRDCHSRGERKRNVSFELDEPLVVSRQANRFRAMGWNTTAYINNTKETFKSRCEIRSGGGDVSYGGLGQCQLSLPDGSTGYSYNVMDELDSSTPKDKCSYALLADESFDFNQDVVGKIEEDKPISFPLVAEWRIPSQDGSICFPNMTSIPPCGKEAMCRNVTGGFGFRCYCKDGSGGNPYLDGSDGCGGK